MSGEEKYPAVHANPSVHMVDCSFEVDGGGDPTAIHGRGITGITHDGTGLYTVTFKLTYNFLLSFNYGLAKPSAHGGAIEVVPAASWREGVKTVQVRVTTAAGAAQDLTAGNGECAMLCFCFQRSGVRVTTAS